MAATLEDAQEALFAKLDALAIAHRTHRHAPVFTVDEAQGVRDNIPGAHTKNLFVKDKKDNFFLLVLEETAEIDLKTVHTTIGAKSRVSFGKPDRLMEYLGVTPGSVTALAAINDRDGKVAIIIDADLAEAGTVNAHPLSNDATTSLSVPDLIRFLQACGRPPAILKISG
jgi:Ala-tRNA(Pro) deacylase